MDILYFQGVRPFRLGGGDHHGLLDILYSKGYDPLGWGGTIMDILYFEDILYFQGVRPFRLGEREPSWTSFTSKGYDPLGWGGNHHGHPLLPRGTTL